MNRRLLEVISAQFYFQEKRLGGLLRLVVFVKISVIGFIIMGFLTYSLRVPDSHGCVAHFQSSLIELFATRLGFYSILIFQFYIFQKLSLIITQCVLDLIKIPEIISFQSSSKLKDSRFADFMKSNWNNDVSLSSGSFRVYPIGSTLE